MNSTLEIAAPVADPEDRLENALSRIERSRSRLRDALLPAQDSHGPGSRSSGGRILRSWHARLRRVLAGTPLAPLVNPACAAARGWWHRNPLRNTVVAIGTVMNNEIGPQVRRHPVLSVSLAAAAGAALVAARPWRWQPLASRANLVQRQALDSALSWSWQQLTQPSVLAALVTGIAAWRGQAVSRADAAAAPVAAQPDLGNLQ